MIEKKYTEEEFLKIKFSSVKHYNVSIKSGSMEPWIGTNEEISVRKVGHLELKKFDIIVFWDKQKSLFICHIFLRIENGNLITTPLRSKKLDDPTPISNLLGVVVKPKFSWFHKVLLRLIKK